MEYKIGDIVKRIAPREGTSPLPVKVGDIGVIVNVDEYIGYKDGNHAAVEVRFFNGCICRNYVSNLELIKEIK